MKMCCAIILILAVGLIGPAQLACAQGVMGNDPSVSFNGASAMWAMQRDPVLPVEGDLDMLQRLRDQALINGNPSMPDSGFWPGDFSRLYSMDAYSKGLPPSRTELQTPTVVPEPSSLALLAVGASCVVFYRRRKT